jgi:hypothetical protein
MPPTSLPDTQTLVLRFLEALGTAETSLSSLSTSVLQLDQATQLLAATTPQLSSLTSLPADLVNATDHLARTLRPGTRRIWLQAMAASLAACLVTVLALTCLRPQWTLTPDQARQLRLGQSIERLYQEMAPARRSRLLELLGPTSSPPLPPTPSSKR